MENKISVGSSGVSSISKNQSQSSAVVKEDESYINTKGIQAGKGSFEPKQKCRKKKKKPKIEEDSECEGDAENTVCLDYCKHEDECTSHSFCVVESLKKRGLFPLKPKGLPWASGRLLYLPGHKPDIYGLTQDELKAIADKKKEKHKKAGQVKNRKLKGLRARDHEKLSHVMNTTQELMLLMRVITMMMENKKSEHRKRFLDMQTESEEMVKIENFDYSAVANEFEGENEGEEELDDVDVVDD